MSFLPWFWRKVSYLLPYGGRRQALTAGHLLVYSILLTGAFMVYHWPHQVVVARTSQSNSPCNNPDECTERINERDVAAAAKITELTHLHVNVTAKPELSVTYMKKLEPKNWIGQGYGPVPSSRGPLRHCRQCALVTSSGHLSGKGAGREIDQSECIIRMNAAPTLNYEADVGSRTTFRVIGHRNFPRMFDTEEERNLYFVNTTTKSEAIVVLWLYSVNVNRNLELILSKKFAQKYKNVTFYLTKQEVMNRNVELFYQELKIPKTKGRLWMSTGWVTMLFALENCDSIDVYGMIYDDYCEEHPGDETYYHYFDTLQKECQYYERSEKRLTSGHKFMTEKVAFGRWASQYRIKFHHPSWANHTYDPSIKKETVFQKAYLQHKQRMSNRTKGSKQKVQNVVKEVDRTSNDEIKNQETDADRTNVLGKQFETAQEINQEKTVFEDVGNKVLELQEENLENKVFEIREETRILEEHRQEDLEEGILEERQVEDEEENLLEAQRQRDQENLLLKENGDAELEEVRWDENDNGNPEIILQQDIPNESLEDENDDDDVGLDLQR